MEELPNKEINRVHKQALNTPLKDYDAPFDELQYLSSSWQGISMHRLDISKEVIVLFVEVLLLVLSLHNKFMVCPRMFSIPVTRCQFFARFLVKIELKLKRDGYCNWLLVLVETCKYSLSFSVEAKISCRKNQMCKEKKTFTLSVLKEC